MDEMKDVEDDVSAEPWIDHNDPEYWREIIQQDLSMAKAVLKSQKYYISGFKCYNAAEKIQSRWFVERNSVNDLPPFVSLMQFAQDTGMINDLTPQEIQLLASLEKFGTAAKDNDYKIELEEELTEESAEKILSETQEFYEFARQLSV